MYSSRLGLIDVHRDNDIELPLLPHCLSILTWAEGGGFR